MQKQFKFTIGETPVVVKEPTMGEIRAWFHHHTSPDNQNPDIMLDEGFFLDVGYRDLLFLTDLDKQQLDQFSVTELKELNDKVREHVPDFFAWSDRVFQKRQSLQ